MILEKEKKKQLKKNILKYIEFDLYSNDELNLNEKPFYSLL